jgi:hypothetical protein
VSSRAEFNKEEVKGSREIRINWPEDEKQKWIQKNEDRLEIMGVKTNLASSSFPVSSATSSSFQFSIPQPGNRCSSFGRARN